MQFHYSFILGISIGFCGALAIAAAFYFLHRHIMKTRKKSAAAIATQTKASIIIPCAENSTVIPDTPVSDISTLTIITPTESATQNILLDTDDNNPTHLILESRDVEDGNNEPSNSNPFSPEQNYDYVDLFNFLYPVNVRRPGSAMFPRANLMTNSTSFVDSPLSFDGGSCDGNHDELNDYKNQDLEILRNAIEESIENVEGMMSLAISNALMHTDESRLDRTLCDGSIEASYLYQMYDWAKKNENPTVDSKHDCLQDVVDRIALYVRFGVFDPIKGARLVQDCAVILGLQLLKEFSMTTLLILGMRKSTLLEQGRKDILDAFNSFGEIDDAAISPNKRGFGK